MPDNIPIKYKIRFEKDHPNVKAAYDLILPVGSPAIIADFRISVAGANLIGPS